MKSVKIRFFLLSFVFFLCALSLQAQFNISGEVLIRPEFRDGYLSLRDSSKTPYATILGRARLLFDYKTEKIFTRFSLYDAWVFGQNNYSSDTISKNTVNIYEAFLKYNFTRNFSVKVGRTELVYDDQRFLGNANWSPWGATHDVVVLQWETPGINYTGHFGFGVNNIAPATIPYLSSYLLKNYKYMGYFWDQKKFFNDKLTVSFLDIVDVFQKPSKTVTTKTTLNDTLEVRDPEGNIIGWTVNTTTTTTSKSFTVWPVSDARSFGRKCSSFNVGIITENRGLLMVMHYTSSFRFLTISDSYTFSLLLLRSLLRGEICLS